MRSEILARTSQEEGLVLINHLNSVEGSLQRQAQECFFQTLLSRA